MRKLSLLFMLLLIIPLSQAITVSPGKSYVEFVPNTTIKGSCSSITGPGCICLSTHGESNITFGSAGPMASIVNSSEFKYVRSTPPYDCFSYDITFPALGEKAGENKVKILAKGYANADSSVKITITVDQKLYVNVDEKYAKPYVPPPLDLTKLFIYTSISLMALAVAILLFKGRK